MCLGEVVAVSQPSHPHSIVVCRSGRCRGCGTGSLGLHSSEQQGWDWAEGIRGPGCMFVTHCAETGPWPESSVPALAVSTLQMQGCRVTQRASLWAVNEALRHLGWRQLMRSCWFTARWLLKAFCSLRSLLVFRQETGYK